MIKRWRYSERRFCSWNNCLMLKAANCTERLNLKTTTFQCSKTYGSPTRATRLKVAPNIANQRANQISLKVSGVARTFGAHGQRTLRGPSPYFITLFLWPLPHMHPYSDFAHIYLYYMILDMALFNQNTSHGVFWKFGSLWWRDGGNGGLDDAMINGTPW